MNQVWTEAEKNFIRANAATMKDEVIAATLTRLSGRVVTLHSVRHIRQNMRIKKKPGYGVCEVVGKLARLLPQGVSLHIEATDTSETQRQGD